MAVVFFVTNSTVQFLSKNAGRDGPSLPKIENRLLSIVDERRSVITPNIYFLVYDSYVPNETMQAYGIDNGSQEDYLVGQGFKLYPHTYSVSSSTIKTMDKVFSASIENYGGRRGISGDGIVQNILKYLGYKTYGIFPSDFMFRGVGSSYDFSFPESIITPPSIHLISAILIGEFRFDIGFTDQPRRIFIETKQSILEGGFENPVFIYTHSDLPNHSQKSGACRPGEIDLFRERLNSANNEMRQDVKTITEHDPDAIIIIAGDHGPFLNKNCSITSGVFDIAGISRQDIQDRYGTFLAIRWPTQDFTRYDDITVLQDLFPAIFAYLYKDLRILESQIQPVITTPDSISGASVNDGIIYGGINNGEYLFLSGR